MAESTEDDVTVEVVADPAGEAHVESTGEAVEESSGEAAAEDGSGDASAQEERADAAAGDGDRGTMRAFVQTHWGELEEDTSELTTMPIPSLPSPKHVSTVLEGVCCVSRWYPSLFLSQRR